MQPERESLFALALNRIPGVGCVTFRRLMEAFGSAEKVFKAGRARLAFVKGVKPDVIDGIVSTDPEKAGAEEMEKVERGGFRVVFFKGPDYPENLAGIYDPPPVLYVAGGFKDTDKISVAIVGSRDPTEYGQNAAKKLSSELAAAGVVIISGMARGIDSAAHWAALDAGGRTIAVLGSGLDVIYPRENDKLFAAIRENGAVVSSFPMGTKPDRGNFPARNRLISGLSLGVIVVQATTPDSGSLITARHALDQGREVFAVPGQVGSQTSRGTNRLIKKGEAKLIESAADVLEEILPQLKVSAKKEARQASFILPPGLDKTESAVYELTGDQPMHIDTISRKCNIPIHELSGTLLSLELKGLVTQQPGMMYIRNTWQGGS